MLTILVKTKIEKREERMNFETTTATKTESKIRLNNQIAKHDKL